MILSSKELPDGDYLQAIFHQQKYDQEVKQIDQTAQMGKYLGGLINFRRIITYPYSQIIEHKDYKQGFIILARLKKSDTIVGKICGLIKDIYLFGKVEKAIYLFDIRVPVTVQKKGIGTFLLENTEEEARRRGVTVQIMSINSNNFRIQNLSNKLGWTDGCRRNIFMASCADGPLTKGEDGDDVKLQFVQPQNVKSEIGKIDLALVDFTDVSSCKNYIGELRASTDTSSASLHLYKGDKEFGINCQRLFFLPQTYKYWYTWVLLYAVFLVCPCLLLWSAFNKNFNIISYLRFTLGLIGIILVFLFLYLLKWVTDILNSPFIRPFGYSFKGKSEEQQKLCRSVYQMARRYAGTTKATLRLNEDPRAEYLPFIKSNYKTFGKGTIFRYKFIGREKVQRLYDQNNFFDPRDL